MASTLLKKVREIEIKAHEEQTRNDQEKEKGKLGYFRGGSCGALTGEAIYSAKCGRLDQARLAGIQKPITADERTMFSSGLGHEVRLEEVFKAAGLSFSKEPEYVIKKPWGTWSGRPDFEIEVDGELIGVEAKALVSNFSVDKHITANWPFMRHLLQAATYLHMLDRKQWLIAVGHYFYADVNKRKHSPGIRWFHLMLEGNRFILTDGTREELLPFKPEHVEAYYREMAAANADKRLMDRPAEFEMGMNSYNRCNYCAMKNECNLADLGKMDFETWLKKLGDK